MEWWPLNEPNGVLDFGGGRLTPGRVQRVEHLLAEINAHALSRETWHSHQLAFRMAAWVIRSVLHGVARGGELRRLGNFQRAQKDLQGEDSCRKEKDC
jgi:hypothetical protein